MATDLVKRRLSEALLARFPGASLDLEIWGVGEDAQIGGDIAWDGFEDMDQMDRQIALREVVRSLPPDHVEQVSFIMTFTAEEKAFMAVD